MKVNASELIGRTIYAKRRTPVLRYPADDSPVLRFVEAGERIGKIYAWIGPKPGQKFWYWQFIDLNAAPGSYDRYHVPHDTSLLDLPQLKQQYNDAREADRRRNLEWWARVVEDGTNAVQAGTNQLYTGAFLLIGGYLLTKAIFSK